MKKKGSFTIGGEFQVDLLVVHRDDRGNGDTSAVTTLGQMAHDEDAVDSTYFGTGLPYGAYLTVNAKANESTALVLKLDLDDSWNETQDQDDLLEEVYFQWTGVRGSQWDLAFGKKAVSYGMDKWVGITPSFNDGWAYWLSGIETYVSADTPHDVIGTNWFPSYPFNVFLSEAVYHYKELASFYLTVFQNNASTGGGRMTRGMHEDRSDDTFLLQSFALKAELTPKEALTLQASFINHHNDSAGDEDLSDFGRYAEEDMQSISIGADYTFKCVPLNVWCEYQHGWNWTYDERTDADVLGAGVAWTATESLTFGLMGEWAQIGDGTWYPTDATGTPFPVRMQSEEYYQAVVNATYTFANEIYVTLEYAHQWYDGDVTQFDGVSADADVDREADMIGVRLGWEF